MLSKTLMAAVALVVILPAAQALPALRPVDDGPQDHDFLTFRAGLRQTVERRDTSSLLEVVHPGIRNSFGDDDGIDAFRRRWRPDEPDSELWQELGSVLALGGTFDTPDVFVAPYVFSRWPREFDAFAHVVLVGADVRLRTAPDSQARVSAVLSYAILRLGGDRGYPQRPWTSVQLPDGRSGFVSSDLVRSPIDYRAYFVRSAGRWKLTVLIAGD